MRTNKFEFFLWICCSQQIVIKYIYIYNRLEAVKAVDVDASHVGAGPARRHPPGHQPAQPAARQDADAARAIFITIVIINIIFVITIFLARRFWMPMLRVPIVSLK